MTHSPAPPPTRPSADPNDAWNRWQWVWIMTFFATLGASLVGALSDPNRLPSERPLFWGLTAVILLSQLGIFYLDWFRGGARNNVWIAAPLFAIQIASWYVLVFRDSVYYIYLFSLFGLVNAGLPRRLSMWANIGLVLGIAIPQFTAFGFSWMTLLIFVVMGFVSFGFGWWIEAIIKQSTERRELLEELEHAQAELVAAERREAQLAERARLARDIHDTLAQSFIGVITHLEAAEQAADDRPKGAHHVRQAQAVARDGLRQARRVVQDLRPQVLEQSETLGTGLRHEAEKWSSHTGIAVTMEVTGDECQLHPQIEVTLLRALQEALANVAKHAAASAVQITLSFIGEQVILDISDNGRGLQNDLPSSNGGGYGLQAMRERVAEIRGELHVESEPGEGVTVAIVVPLESGTMEEN